MSTKAADDPNPNSSNAAADEEESEGGLMPAILAGGGILAVVALLVFWPTGDNGDGDGVDSGRAGAGANGAARANGRAGAKGGSPRGQGGVAARQADDPDNVGAAGFRRNRNIPAIEGMGLAPGVPQEEPPPKFNNLEQEITWYEGRLDKALKNLETRTSAMDRLKKKKAAAAGADDAETRLATLEGRGKLVEANFERAKVKVEEVKKKLADLRGE